VKRIKEGDEFACKCGEVVTVTRYVDASNVEITDKDGISRTVDSFSLRAGIRWRKVTEMWASNLTRKEALRLEKLLIAEHNPKCNVYKT
jgi:hypothetical protein